MRKIILASLICFCNAQSHAQLIEQKLNVSEKFLPFIDSSHHIMLPGDYEISVFYAGELKRPRFLAIGPNNTLCVADMNDKHILALPDRDHNGIADTAIDISSSVDSAHSLGFYNGALYVAEPSRVRKFMDVDKDGYYETEESFITGIGASGPYNHYTRTILFDTIGKHIYVSVGASCNACRETDPERATILQFDLDGKGRHVYASGLRNALGLAINPKDNRLWAANADRDNQGDDEPPEIISSVHNQDFFGWPFVYGNHHWDNFSTPEYQSLLPITQPDSIRVEATMTPDILIEPHSTPMAMIFYQDPRVYIAAPPLTAFVALHGSSPGGRTIGVGYKVIKLQYDDFAQRWSVSDFLTGFLTDSMKYSYWGRPCGLVQDSTGDIFLSSDVGIPAIYRIHLRGSTSVKSVTQQQARLSVNQNPITATADIQVNMIQRSTIKLALLNQLGTYCLTVFDGVAESGDSHFKLDASQLSNGVYYLQLESQNFRAVEKVIILR
ncbi:MAG: PQQ-dependent sugar dehydrogenase [bacterium]